MMSYVMKFNEATVKESFEVRGIAQKIIPAFRMDIIMPHLFSA